MAEINSIALGKARGKLGNVVFYVDKGQALSRQYVETENQPNTTIQLEARARFLNAKKIYDNCKSYFDKLIINTTTVKTLQSLMMKTFIPYMSSENQLYWYNAMDALSDKNFFASQWIQVFDNEFDVDHYNILITTGQFAWSSDLRIRYAGTDSETNIFQYFDYPISEVEFNGGIIVTDASPQRFDFMSAYIYNPILKMSSNLMYFRPL